MDTIERWLSLEEISKHLGVSKDTVRSWIKKDTIPLKIIDQMNNPISRAVREGRPKEEIKEMLIRDAATIAVYQMAEKKAAEIAKQAAKNAYKK